MKIKEIFLTSKPVIVLLAICLVISFALAGVNAITAGPIEAANKKAEQDALASVMPNCEFSTSDKGYVIASKEGVIQGYVFTTSAKGYGGDCKVMTAIATDGKIAAIAMVDISNETVGLGQKASEKSFTEQFEGLFGEIGVIKNAKPSGNEVAAITGATVTTKAVAAAVNEALEIFETEGLGGKTDEQK